LVFKSVEVEGEEVISFKAINNQYLLSHGGWSTIVVTIEGRLNNTYLLKEK
jgi:hypothetical protein